jgi:HD-like signal output (HDOD) protein
MVLQLASPLPKINYENMLTKLSNVDDLPTLPSVISRIIRATEQDNTGSKELMQIIINDQSLSAKILRVANSAFYGMRYKITSVDNAISVIGFDEIKRIAISAFVAKSFPDRLNVASFPLEKFWVHSVGVAYISRRILAHHPEEVQNVAFTAGLLHDIGKLIFCQFMAKHFFLVIHYTQSLKHEMCEVEQSVVGLNHGQTGQILATLWDLPPIYARILQQHHIGEYTLNMATGEDHFLAAVNLADTMVRRLGIGFSGNIIIPEYREEVHQFLGLGAADMQALEQEILPQKDHFSMFM